MEDMRSLRESLDLTQAQLAEKVGTSQPQIKRLESGERELTRAWAEKIAPYLHTTPVRLIFPELAEDPGTRVPLISWISAGAMMSERIADEALGAVKVSDLPPGDWIALRVLGNSMDRISPPESIILVNRTDKRLVSNACYVIANENGDATYKRFRADPMRFEPVSTDPEHEPIFPDREPLIVGRVRRSMIDM